MERKQFLLPSLVLRIKRDNAPEALRERLALGKDSKQAPGGEPGSQGGGGVPGQAALTSLVPALRGPQRWISPLGKQEL